MDVQRTKRRSSSPRFCAELPLSGTILVRRRLVSHLRLLQHLHSVGIFHRDIKPANILAALWTSIADLHLKLADFGLAGYIKNRLDRLVSMASQASQVAANRSTTARRHRDDAVCSSRKSQRGAPNIQQRLRREVGRVQCRNDMGAIVSRRLLVGATSDSFDIQSTW